MSKGREIPNFPGYYITKAGKVWSEKTGRFLRGTTRKDGRRYVSLHKESDPRAYSRSVARLLLETYVGPGSKGTECCHNNGNAADNKLSNLRWDTHKNNIGDALKHKTHNCLRKGESSPRAILNLKQVHIIKYLLRFPNEFILKEIGKIFGVSMDAIHKIKKGKNWKNL